MAQGTLFGGCLTFQHNKNGRNERLFDNVVQTYEKMRKDFFFMNST